MAGEVNVNNVKIIKRNGEVVDYDGSKIVLALEKAMTEDGLGINSKMSAEIEQEVFEEICNEFHQGMFTVEQIQDMLEDLLIRHGRIETAKNYIRYRDRRKQEREKKWDMSDLQYDIWSQKYEYKNEGFEGFLDRVSNRDNDLKKIIRQKKFLFGGRILANRGLQKLDNRKITLSNCYVITPPEDNLESIFEVAKKLARTFSYGGGCGINLNSLRPNNAKVNNSANTTSGAVSFMELYSMVTGIIGQKNRRGALMLSMSINHPDIEEFIDVKKDLDKVTKANISIEITDEFMMAVKEDKDFTMGFTVEDTGEVITKTVKAKKLFYKFALANWDNAEPGAIFWGRIENWNLLSEDGEFEYAGVNP